MILLGAFIKTPTLESMNSVQNEVAFKNVQYKTNEEAYSNGTILKADYEKAQQGLVEEIKSSKQSYVELEKNSEIYSNML